MRNYIFYDPRCLQKRLIPKQEIQLLLNRVAETTDTSDLVVSIYFVGPTNWSGGTAYVRNWMQAEQFITSRGKWSFTNDFSVPNDLPYRFKLIRILPKPLQGEPYPQRLRDGYGWEFYYQSFADHLALVFAHELHHFRRYHLGLHQGEGERSANRWALGHVKQLGFQVQGKRFAPRSPSTSGMRSILKKVIPDPFVEFRPLVPGNRVLIQFDPSGRYLNVPAEVIRPIRANSKRMVIRTPDNRMWRWPMDWLCPIPE